MRTLSCFLLVPLMPTAGFIVITLARDRVNVWEILPAFLMICYPWCWSVGGMAYVGLRHFRRDGFVACGFAGAFIAVLYFLIPFALGPDRFELSRSLLQFPLLLAATGVFSGVFFRSLRGPFARSAKSPSQK